MRNSLIVLLVLILTGCNAPWWPKYSTGGYAQKYLFTTCYQKKLRKKPCLLYLSDRLARLNQKAYPLHHSHIGKCLPARIRLLDDLSIQIAQQIATGLKQGAMRDLILYEENINDLIRLNHRYRSCPKHPASSRSWEQLKMRLQ
jgi:hypothetical protein